MLLTLSLIDKCKKIQLDNVLEFLQAPVEKKIYMEIPKGFELGTKGDTT